ncbi:MAG: hypothetical protein WB608_00255, partial [Terracidiphilus sp.]
MYIAFSLALAVTILLIVPFYPSFTALDLTSSWADAMNEAIFRNLVIGRDVIFTYGPLASVSMQMYHPATDVSMLRFSVFFAAAVFAGFVSVSRGNYLILTLPLILSQVTSPFDSLYICFPFLFL